MLVAFLVKRQILGVATRWKGKNRGKNAGVVGGGGRHTLSLPVTDELKGNTLIFRNILYFS